MNLLSWSIFHLRVIRQQKLKILWIGVRQFLEGLVMRISALISLTHLATGNKWITKCGKMKWWIRSKEKWSSTRKSKGYQMKRLKQTRKEAIHYKMSLVIRILKSMLVFTSLKDLELIKENWISWRNCKELWI